MSDPIHAGDTPTLAWDLDPAPPADATVKVIIAKPGADPIVNRAGTLAGARISITLTSAETAESGRYRVSSRSTKDDDVRTYPSHEYEVLVIEPSLAPLDAP